MLNKIDIHIIAKETIDISMIEDDLYNVIPFLVEQVSKKARRYSQREFDEKDLGITIDQWVLLKIIERNDGISQRELAGISMRDGASITRSLDLLEKRGLILRNPIPENRRQYAITLEKDGKEFIAQNMEMIQRHRSQLVAGFDASEIKNLKSYLNRMADNME
ncbi:MAG: MarR family transcriptional regulator [Cyclobacteriaceae bacterium]